MDATLTARRVGRPRTIDSKTRALVRDMAAANPLWGAPRIHGKLRTLGIDISERTVSRLLTPRRRPPSQTWRTFLANHVASAVSMDFFTVPTVTGRVLFVLLVLAHERRRVVHFNVTEHPTAEWTAQQIVDAFPNNAAPRWLLRDRDSFYSDAFKRRVADMAIIEVVTSPASPWQNAFVERLIGSIRRECLNYVIVLNAAHLRRVLTRTCATTMAPARISGSRKMRLTAVLFPPPQPARSWRGQRLAGFIIATNVSRHKRSANLFSFLRVFRADRSTRLTRRSCLAH
jgi:transposase InsO family protein